ncbi:MAG: carboxypeptidase-like regulatory domain-containing protein, partial [Bacteroidota bacterium]|nr:carboxypeptidase-like regulatory domain-containing protein [Bacteroidota bacterium]
MRHSLNLLLFLFIPVLLLGQTKAGGLVFDSAGNPVPFANVVFAGSSEGTITNEDGRFYLQSDNTYDALKVTFIGFQAKEVLLPQRVNYNLEITLEEETES